MCKYTNFGFTKQDGSAINFQLILSNFLKRLHSFITHFNNYFPYNNLNQYLIIRAYILLYFQFVLFVFIYKKTDLKM